LARGKKTQPLTIDIPLEKADERRLLALRELVMEFPGPQTLYLRFRTPEGHEVRLRADRGYAVRDEIGFRARLAEILG
jgi:hypothetical protein